MQDSTFGDPAGLDDGNAYRGGPLMSAYDLAIATRNALPVPLLAHLAASPSVSFVGPDGVHHTLTNHNKLVREHLYPGATGFKTGFTNKAEHTLVATATRNGRTLIAVILGTVRRVRLGRATSSTPGSRPRPATAPATTLPPVAGHDLRVRAARAHRVPAPSPELLGRRGGIDDRDAPPADPAHHRDGARRSAPVAAIAPTSGALAAAHDRARSTAAGCRRHDDPAHRLRAAPRDRSTCCGSAPCAGPAPAASRGAARRTA